MADERVESQPDAESCEVRLLPIDARFRWTLLGHVFYGEVVQGIPGESLVLVRIYLGRKEVWSGEPRASYWKTIALRDDERVVRGWK